MPEGFGPEGADIALDALGAAYPWIQLHVGAPGAAGTANPATETTRQQATWAAAVNGLLTNGADLEWVDVAGAEDYTHFTAWSAATNGTFGFSGTISANAVAVDDEFTVPAGELQASLTLAS